MLLTKSSVTHIGFGTERRYRITYSTTVGSPDETKYQEFDQIILTAPLATANITSAGDLNTSTPMLHIEEDTSYSDLHVTHVFTTEPLSAKYFNAASASAIPHNILTTSYVADFLTISTSTHRYWGEYCPPELDYCIGMPEQAYLHKITSQRPPTDETLMALIDECYRPDLPLSNQTGIIWAHRQAWPKSVSYYRPGKSFFDAFKLGPGLFYTAGAQEVVSSMELACRMGQNAAHRVIIGF